jgi:hypothetical protein
MLIKITQTYRIHRALHTFISEVDENFLVYGLKNNESHSCGNSQHETHLKIS